MKHIMVLAGLFFVFNAVSGQKVIISRAATKHPSDISHLEAVRLADQFLDSINLPRGIWINGKALLSASSPDGNRRKWILGCGIYMIKVDAQNPRVKSFNHMARQNDQFKRRNRTGHVMYSTDLAAKNRLREVASQCGLGENIIMSHFSNKRDGTVRDANTCGYIGATFKRNGKTVARIMCDVQDGVPVSIVLD